MAFSPAFLDELMARNPIEDVVGQYVTLKRSGANLFGLCPFHGEKTASFSVVPDKGMYYCFGCHKGGGAVNFLMEIEGLSYPDAVRNLAARVGLAVPDDEQYESQYKKQERLWAANKEAARFFYAQLYAPIGKAALEYAYGRGMPKATLTNFGIGYAPDTWDSLVKHLRSKGYTDEELKDSGLVTVSQKNGNLFDRFRDRLMFPIIDVRGNVIGFGGRIMKKDENAAKYLNSPETLIFNKRKNLFALNLAKKSKLDYLILVEGYMDAIALHQYGFDCAVASLGTALTADGATLLSKYTQQVVLIYDGDTAGQNATQRAIPLLERAGLKVRVLQLQDEFLHKFGADKFKLLLEDSANRIEYQLNAIFKKYDLRIDDQKVQCVQEASDLIATLDSPIKREIYGKRVAEAAGISDKAVELEVQKAGVRRRNRQKRAQEKIDLAPAQQFQRRGSTNVRYDNVKSGVAEQRLIAMALREPALLDLAGDLQPEQLSVPLFTRVFAQMMERHRQHQSIALAVLTDISADEMSHLAAMLYEQDVVNEAAFADCIRTIKDEYQSGHVSSDEDLRAIQKRMQQRKGTL